MALTANMRSHWGVPMRFLSSFAAAAVLVSLTATTAASAAPSLTVTNGTHFAVLAMKMKPQGGPWQQDILHGNTIGIGQKRTIALPKGTSCSVDLVAVLNDGHKVSLPSKNVCTGAAVTVADDRK